MWVGKRLPLFWCLMKGEYKREKFAFMRYKQCLPSFDEDGEALRSACLKMATAGSRDKRHDVKKEAEDRDAVAAVERSGVILF